MRKLLMAVVAASSVLATGTASAAPFSAQEFTTQPLVQKAYYYHRWHRGWWGPRVGIYGGPIYAYGYGGGGGGYCYRWRRVCADRWGWGGPGFRRCLWRHGC